MNNQEVQLNKQQKNNNSITLSDILRVLKKNWILIAIITVVIFALGAVYTFAIAKEKYKSTSSIVCVVTESTSPDINVTNSRNITFTICDSLVSDAILDDIAKENDLTTSALRRMVSVSTNENSFLIYISVTTTDPELSQTLANAIADGAIEAANNSTDANLSPLFYAKDFITKVDTAKLGSYAAPNKKLYLIVSLLAGLVVAAVVVFIKEFASNKFQSVDEIETIGYPVLNALVDNKTMRKKQDSLIEPVAKNFEPYNKLISNIKFSNVDNPYKAIMFTSSVMEELKTTVCSNYAYTLAHNGKKVIVLDLDTRKPRVHKTFSVTKEKGIVEYLDGSITKAEVIKQTDKGVDVITVGKDVVNPITLLESDKLKAFIEELKKDYDYIVIDTPPLTACNDAAIISKLADAVVFNVAINQAKKKEVKLSLAQLQEARANIIGINITKANIKDRGEYYYYDYSDK